MAYHYSDYRSEMMEQTMLPILAVSQGKSGWDFTPNEVAILSDALDVLDEIREVFAPFKEEVRPKTLLTNSGVSLLTSCYLYALNQGYDFHSMEELHDYVLGLTADELDYCLRFMIAEESVEESLEMDLMDLLEQSSENEAYKWQFMTFSRNPLENIKKTVDLSRKMVALYHPFLERGRAERKAYANQLSVDEMVATGVILQLEKLDFASKEVEVYVVSPWIVRLVLLSSNNYQSYPYFLILSCRIDEVLATHNELDEDNFAAALKTLSDLSRYKVLVALTKPHAKSKDIAEVLGITSAAVSFHRQKLVNAQLLLLNNDDKTVKYDVNKELMERIIDKFIEDLELESRKGDKK